MGNGFVWDIFTAADESASGGEMAEFAAKRKCRGQIAREAHVAIAMGEERSRRFVFSGGSECGDAAFNLGFIQPADTGQLADAIDSAHGRFLKVIHTDEAAVGLAVKQLRELCIGHEVISDGEQVAGDFIDARTGVDGNLLDFLMT